MYSVAYIPSITGLRAIAVTMVLIFHFDLLPVATGGFMGVDVFFVISGYLITSIITKQIHDGTFDFTTFYINRIRRLAPALLTSLVLTLLVGSIILFPIDFSELAKQILASQTYMANVYFWRNINYFGLHADSVPLLHIWSLSIEEQFYLVYPLALFLIFRYFRYHLWHLLVAAMVVSFALSLAMVGSKPEATFFLLPTRAWEFLVGAMILRVDRNFKRSNWLNELLGICGILLLVSSLITYRSDIAFPGWFAILPTSGAAFLILSGRDSFTGDILSRRPFAYVGELSYPLYLVHWPIKVFATYLVVGDLSPSGRYFLVILSFLLAMLIYHAVEMPVRSRTFFAHSRSLVASYIASVGATIATVGLIIGTNGLPIRFPDDVVEIAQFANDRERSTCEYRGRNLTDDACVLGTSGRTPQWLIYGDSHAFAARQAIDKWLKHKGEAGLLIFRSSCPPLFNVHLFGDRGGCYKLNEAVLAFLKDSKLIKDVFLVSTWRQAAEARLSNSSDRLLSKEASEALFMERLPSTINTLHSIGKSVRIWEPVPGAKKSVPSAMARAALTGNAVDIGYHISEYRESMKVFFRALEMVPSSYYVSFSPSKALCVSTKCVVEMGGRPLYWDDAHIAHSSSDFWASELIKQE